MLYNINNLITIALILSFQTANAKSEIDGFSKSSSSVFVVTQNGVKNHLKLDIAIADWTVDCTKIRAVVWGSTLTKLPVGVVPYTKIFVLYLTKMRVLSFYKRSLRFYGEVEFDKHSKLIVVDEDVIDFETGELKPIFVPPALEK